MPEPIDKKKWTIAKKEADKIYKKHSAYKSGFIVKKYKELGGKFREDHKQKPLKRWFDEKWTNQHGTVGYKHKDDVYRPSKRVSKKTPKTWNELTKNTIEKAKRSKSAGKRASFN